LGFRGQGDELLDIATPKIVIRRNSKVARGRSGIDCFGFRRLRDKVLDHQIRDSVKSDLPKYKGEFLEVNCGCRFSERKIEEPFLRALQVSVRGKMLCT
jgi:hypothetical protein